MAAIGLHRTARWRNTTYLGADPVAELLRLKREDGPVLVTQGSTELVHLLLANDLVDELRLMTFPVLLGKGKRLFGSDAAPATFKLLKTRTGPKGGIVTAYAKAGGVETGAFPGVT